MPLNDVNRRTSAGYASLNGPYEDKTIGQGERPDQSTPQQYDSAHRRPAVLTSVQLRREPSEVQSEPGDDRAQHLAQQGEVTRHIDAVQRLRALPTPLANAQDCRDLAERLQALHQKKRIDQQTYIAYANALPVFVALTGRDQSKRPVKMGAHALKSATQALARSGGDLEGYKRAELRAARNGALLSDYTDELGNKTSKGKQIERRSHARTAGELALVASLILSPLGFWSFHNRRQTNNPFTEQN